MSELTAILQRIEQRLVELVGKGTSLVLTRADAARELKISVRQLHRLIAAGHIKALPSGIARAELERYVSTPTERVRYRSTGQRATEAKTMAERGRERLRQERSARR